MVSLSISDRIVASTNLFGYLNLNAYYQEIVHPLHEFNDRKCLVGGGLPDIYVIAFQ